VHCSVHFLLPGSYTVLEFGEDRKPSPRRPAWSGTTPPDPQAGSRCPFPPGPLSFSPLDRFLGGGARRSDSAPCALLPAFSNRLCRSPFGEVFELCRPVLHRKLALDRPVLCPLFFWTRPLPRSVSELRTFRSFFWGSAETLVALKHVF